VTQTRAGPFQDANFGWLRGRQGISVTREWCGVTHFECGWGLVDTSVISEQLSFFPLNMKIRGTRGAWYHGEAWLYAFELV
jgi:hypothetical protein